MGKWKLHQDGSLYPVNTYTKSYYNCHTGNVLVFSTPHLKIFGGGVSRGASPESVDISLNLTGRAEVPSVALTLNEEAKTAFPNLKPIRIKTKEVIIDWPDYSIIPADRAWWEHFVETIKKYAEKQKTPQTMLVHCMGGHGRTGTALAIIGCLLNLIPQNECPVTFIRNKYCKNAIESTNQIRYIEQITQRKIKEWSLTKRPYVYGY